MRVFHFFLCRALLTKGARELINKTDELVFWSWDSKVILKKLPDKLISVWVCTTLLVAFMGWSKGRSQIKAAAFCLCLLWLCGVVLRTHTKNVGACETTGLCHFLHFEKAFSPAQNSEHFHCILKSTLVARFFIFAMNTGCMQTLYRLRSMLFWKLSPKIYVWFCSRRVRFLHLPRWGILDKWYSSKIHIATFLINLNWGI